MYSKADITQFTNQTLLLISILLVLLTHVVIFKRYQIIFQSIIFLNKIFQTIRVFCNNFVIQIHLVYLVIIVEKLDRNICSGWVEKTEHFWTGTFICDSMTPFHERHSTTVSIWDAPQKLFLKKCYISSGHSDSDKETTNLERYSRTFLQVYFQWIDHPNIRKYTGCTLFQCISRLIIFNWTSVIYFHYSIIMIIVRLWCIV